ncbi:MAG: DegT/DnrJ/EryC1/StrS family aminotransferase, partial [Verrucomicrobiae bacterium]|nr:DegT/DnrJ/EryC1/StrS family aminotransferase [Verrucomicrobiae bacterium]
GAPHAIGCASGTDALLLALMALDVGPGDEIITTPFTFFATAGAPARLGARPVFVDIEAETFNIDLAAAEAAITPRTKAIIPVHVAGRMADMEAINALATDHRLVVIEDAAHAWGSQWRGRGAGTLGRCGTFSFQVSKNLTAGEGGIMVTDDEELADLCRSFTHCGRRKGSAWYDHDYLGSNLRMTEFQAAVLLAQLERLPEQLARREQNARLLDEGMRDLPGIRLLAPAPDMTRRSYHMFIFRVDAAALGLSRARFIKALQAEGLPVSEGWYRPLYRNGVFANAHVGPQHGIKSPLAAKGVDYREANCPVCEQVCRDAVWIPHPVLLAEEPKIQSAITAIRKVIGQAGSLVGGD